MYFPSTFPLFQQDPVFVFRNYLSLMSMVNQSLHTSHCRGQRGRNFLSFQGRRGWTSELRSVNQTLYPGLWIVSEVTQRCEEGAKAVTPVCGSAWAPALLLPFAHAHFCSIPINSGDSQSPSSGFPFCFCWLNKHGLPVVVACHWSALTEREFTSRHHSAVRSRHHQPQAVYGLGARARGLKDSPQSSQWGRGRARVGSHGVDLYFRDTPSRFTWKTLFWTQRGCI